MELSMSISSKSESDVMAEELVLIAKNQGIAAAELQLHNWEKDRHISFAQSFLVSVAYGKLLYPHPVIEPETDDARERRDEYYAENGKDDDSSYEIEHSTHCVDSRGKAW
jgi:hypothetical protein